MKDSKLSMLLGKIEDLSQEATGMQNEYSVETINEDVSRNLKGGGYDNSNGSCTGINSSCANGSCVGSTNTGCSNATC
jgi:hypothetical protein